MDPMLAWALSWAVSCAAAGAQNATVVGYRGDGSAVFDGRPPIACNDTTGQNILWKVPLPNWGHSHPVVVAGKVLVTSEGGWPAGEDLPSLLCFDAGTGKQLWRRRLDHLPATGLPADDLRQIRQAWADFLAKYRLAYTIFNEYTYQDKAAAIRKFQANGWTFGGWRGGGYGQLRSMRWNDHAARAKLLSNVGRAGLTPETWQHGCGLALNCFGQSFATPVTDGRFVWVATAFGGFFCFDLDGKLRWMRFVPGQAGEYCRNGRSPLLWKDLLISDITGLVRAFDRQTGQLRWSAKVGVGSFLTPAVISCGGVDVLWCAGPKAFRLPEGTELAIEGWTETGNTAVVKTDERDVVFMTYGGQHGAWDEASSIVPPAAVRFGLEGDILKARLLFSGIGGKRVCTYTGMTYYGGRLYHACGAILDAATGEIAAGGVRRRDPRHRAVPQTRHLLLIAGGHVYGLNEIGGSESKHAQQAVLAAYTVDGRKVAASVLHNAAPTGEKRKQIVEQNGWNTWGFSYACPFTIDGDRLFVRSNDYLFCIGHSIRGTPADDEAALAGLRRAASAAELVPLLAHPGARCRYEAAKKLLALGDPAARSALAERVAGDVQPEVRAVAVRALDGLDPKAKPGSAALRALVQPAALDAMREWWKPEKVEPWNLQRQVLHALGAEAEPTCLAMLADKDEWVRSAGAFAIADAWWPMGERVRDALTAAVTGDSSDRVRQTAVRALADRWPDEAGVQSAFRALLADAEWQGSSAAAAFEALLDGAAGDDRREFILRTVRTAQNRHAFAAAAKEALSCRPPLQALPAALARRAQAGHLQSVTFLAEVQPPEQALPVLRELLSAKGAGLVLEAARGLLEMQAGAEREALAALRRLAAGRPGSAWELGRAAEILGREGSRLSDAGLRATVAAMLGDLLGLDNPGLQRRVCGALGALGAEAKVLLPELRKLTGHADVHLRKAAEDAIAKIGQ